jgi:hypothetical protein
MKFSDGDAEDKKVREKFQNQLTFLHLYALSGKADAAYTAKDFAKAGEILDPLVNEVKANPNHLLKTNLPLGQFLLSLALRSYIQSDKLDRARVAVQALRQLSGTEGDGAATALQQLLALINKQLGEVRKENNPDKLKKAIVSYSALLDDVAKNAPPTNQFILSMVQCYSSMDQHAKALDLLSKYPKPKDDDEEGKKLYKASQLATIRELRLNKEIKKAKPIFDEIMGTPPKDLRWGSKNIDALKEWVTFLIEEERYAEAYGKSSTLVKQLKDKVEDLTTRDHYLDFYYQMVVSKFKFAQASKDMTKKERYIAEAGKNIEELEKRFKGFGNEITTTRFQELLKTEKDLKDAYEKAKAEK